LRDRKQDIPLLLRHFLNQAGQELNTEIKTLKPDAEAFLSTLEWPGNVRQLAQFVERVYVFGTFPDLPDDPAPEPSPPAEAVATWASVASPDASDPPLPVLNLDELRRIAVRQALAATGGHKGRAAALLGVHLNTMTKFVAEPGLGRELLPARSIGRPRRPR